MKVFTHYVPALLLVSMFFSFTGAAQNVGINEANPGSRLSVKGNLAIGSGYSLESAPVNGAIIQGSVGIATALPDTNSVLDMSGATKGILLPVVNTSQMNAIANPKTGLFIFNSDSSNFNFYNGTNWVNGPNWKSSHAVK